MAQMMTNVCQTGRLLTNVLQVVHAFLQLLTKQTEPLHLMFFPIMFTMRIAIKSYTGLMRIDG